MTDYSIDTLSTAENLKASGFSESQAKAITETVQEAQQQNLDALILQKVIQKMGWKILKLA